MATKMTAAHKKFIREKLIPFILREQGRGFGMSHWLDDSLMPGQYIASDGVWRPIPDCGTVACIGGSIDALCGRDRFPTSEAGRRIGLNARRSSALFFGWNTVATPENRYDGWPKKFHRRFHACTTTIGKARVACDLLKAIARTSGKILGPENGRDR